MSTPSFASSASSSRSASPSSADVFVSFRGRDARRVFADHLIAALIEKGVSAFDDNRFERGIDILGGIGEAINHSRCSVVVFSENYTDSDWCMDELVMIHERWKQGSSYKVFPVFYHVDPNHVLGLTGSYGQAFAKLKQKFSDDEPKVSKWEAANKELAKISGWDIQNGNEHDFIQDIVQKIMSHLTRTPSDIIAAEGASGGVNDQSPEETSNRRPQDAVSGNLQSAHRGSHLSEWQGCVVFFVVFLFVFVLVPAILLMYRYGKLDGNK